MPGRIVETLEAVKLFLSVKKSTFIFAIDEEIVRYAIRQQYPAIEINPKFDISKDYIEKIIQIPITLPELSAKDIENYMMLLVVDEYVSKEKMPTILDEVQRTKLLVATTNISKNQITKILVDKGITLADDKQKNFALELGIIDEIRVVVSSSLKGNPRQAKRFLNAFSIKKELATLYFGNDIDLRYLAKLLALYLINQDLFKMLQNWACGYTGDIKELHSLVDKANNNEEISESGWGDKKVVKWLRSEPQDIYKYDLSQYFYLTRDITPERDDSESRLNAYEKKAMSEIMNFPTVSIEQIVKTLKNNTGINLDKLITVIIDNYQNGSLKLEKIYYFVEYYPEYKTQIYSAISNKAQEMKPGDVPFLKKMYLKNSSDFGIVLTKLPDRMQKLIKGEK